MIQVGDIVVTSYGTGPYVVIGIHRGCRCPDYIARIDCDGTPCNHKRSCEDDCPLTREATPHLHLMCATEQQYQAGAHKQLQPWQLPWLNGYVEEQPGVLRNVWRREDTISVIGHVAGMQTTLDLEV